MGKPSRQHYRLLRGLGCKGVGGVKKHQIWVYLGCAQSGGSRSGQGQGRGQGRGQSVRVTVSVRVTGDMIRVPIKGQDQGGSKVSVSDSVKVDGQGLK